MGAPTSTGAWKSQARALVRKNLRYQGRKGCQNCCLIFLPLVFMGCCFSILKVNRQVLFRA